MTRSPAPPALRLIHAIVFFGFAGITVAGTHPELSQLARALTQRYHSGTPPHAVACASGLLAGVLAAVLVALLLLRRTVPLWVSALMLLAFSGSLTLLKFEPRSRTVPGANLKGLEQAKALHERLRGPLQKTGRVPDDAQTLAMPGDSPFYRRPFAALPWRVERVRRTDVLPDGAQPGWLLLHAEEAAFAIAVVGIDEEGEPGLLRQGGNPVEYRGAYNPDTLR